MKELKFSWRMGDIGLRAVPPALVKINPDDQNETIELVHYYQWDGKECLYTIGYFWWNTHEPCWELKFVGGRFTKIPADQIKDVWMMLNIAYQVLTEWKERENGDD